MQPTILPGVAMWSVWQPDRNLFFNSFFVETAEGNLAVDPLPLPDPDAEEIAAAICWLLSDAARGVTGEALNVSAGQTMV